MSLQEELGCQGGKFTLTEIGSERRNGYSLLGYGPEDLLAKDYPSWEKKWLVINRIERKADGPP